MEWHNIEEQIAKELEIDFFINLNQKAKDNIKFIYDRYNVVGYSVDLICNEENIILVFYIQSGAKIKKIYHNIKKENYNINTENLQEELYENYKKAHQEV